MFPQLIEKSIEQGRFTVDYNNVNSMKQDPLLLVDVSIIFKRNRKKSNSQFTLQISNILNQRAITGTRFDYEKGAQAFQYGTGLIPLLNWKVTF